MLENMLCHSGDTIMEALKRIDENAKGAIFVIDNDGGFVGTLTDGDLRRAFIAKRTVSTPLHDLLHGKESIWMPFGTPLEDLVRMTSPVIRIIPLLDDNRKVVDYFELKADFRAPIASTELNGNEMLYVIECIATNWISSQGMYVTQFEEQFSSYIGTKYGVAVANGTVALHLALAALGIGVGDEVLIPDLTFAATINAVIYTGATPVLVDVDRDSWCIDPFLAEKAVTVRTKAIIPVHLYGHPCDMTEIKGLAERHGLYIVEDCAEAHGALHQGRRVGSIGDISCFSFYGNKILTMGEGGVCLTSDPHLDERMRTLRDHGMSSKKRYWHDVIGYNYRLTNLQAAIGVAQLERVEEILAKRLQIAHWYESKLGSCDVFRLHNGATNSDTVTWLYSCLIATGTIDRDMLIESARCKGVDIRPFFYPLHVMPPYSRYANGNDFPASQRLAAVGISLPTLTSLDEGQYDKICAIILNCVRELQTAVVYKRLAGVEA